MSAPTEAEVFHKHLDAKLQIKALSETGEFEGFASAYTIDSDAERIAPGAFTRTLQHSGGKIPILFGHSTNEPCGWNIEAKEVPNKGLWVKGKLTLETEIGRKAYYFLKGAQDVGARGAGLSIGFRSIKSHFENIDKDDSVSGLKKGASVRVFDEVSLMEYSVCVFQANSQAFVTAVKSSFDSQQNQSPAEQATAPGTQREQKSMATTDFDSSLAELQRQRALQKHRNDIEDAKYHTIAAIHSDTEHDAEAKKSMIKDCYMKHAAAMADWHVQNYFGDHAKSFDGSLYQKSEVETSIEQKAEAADQTALQTKSKGKMSAASAATMKHALDLHQSALDLHGKAIRIVKDMFGDDSSSAVPGSDTGTEMGAMSDEGATEQKTDAPVVEEKTSTDPVETKAEAPVQSESEGTPQANADSDSGIHSLAEEIAALTKSRLESLNNG